MKKKKRQSQILLPWDEEIFNVAEEEDIGVLKRDKVTFALLIVVLIKNMGDLLFIVYDFIKTLF
jgi:hypothetical protein